MKSYILKRLIFTIPVLLGISVIVFFIMALIPGDPALAILGSYATPENLAKLREEFGLDKPLLQQYFIWLTNMLQGDFGRSYSLNRPVLDEVLERLGPTLLLAGTSLLLCTILGLVAGIVSAVKQYGWQDKILTLLVLIGISTPSFWLGLILVLLFSVQLQWFPASGMFAIYGGGDLKDLLQHLVLPAITLAVVATGVIARLTRTAMLEVVHYDPETNTHYVASGFGEKSQWYQNIMKTPEVTIQVGNKKIPAVAERLSQVEAEKIFEIYERKHPYAIKNLSKLIGYQIGDRDEDMQAFRQAIPIIAFHPTT